MQGNRLQGDGTWGWLNASVENEDIVVVDAICTWFGGDSDPMDSGETASGVLTRGHPDLMGCALPMNVHNSACAGSPIPRVPWQTQVRVWNHATNLTVTVPVIDLGPGKRTHHALDLTQAAFEALGGEIESGIMRVNYRVIGGTKCIKRG